MTTMDIIMVSLAVVLIIVMVILGILATDKVNEMTDEEWLEMQNTEFHYGHEAPTRIYNDDSID